MNKILFVLFFALFATLLHAQNPDGNYNPFVSEGIISPSPLLPLEVNGTGVASFNIGNTGSDPLDVFASQYITLTITLSSGVPDNANPLLAISGTSAGLFSWSYNAGTYSATQIASIPANSSGTISIAYKVTQNSVTPGSNGFNVNISPAPYQTTSNTTNDDAVSSYTYTELKDFSDAPASYGSADHVIDFLNYMGAIVDGEPASLSSAAADGDDLNGQDDEDGVTFPALIHQGESVNLSVTVVGLGRVNAWIDWNGDGDFADAGEQVANNLVRSDGTSNIPVNVPISASVSAPTYARFRFTTGTFSSSSGPAPNGEVEDYRLTILCEPIVPTLASNDADNTFCTGTSVIFTAGGGTGYNFRVAGASVQSGALTTYTTSALTNGQVVDVIVSNASGCNATSAGITNTVNPNPTANAGSALTAICQGGTSAALGGTVGGSATGGTWSTPAGGTFLPNANTLNATWTPPPGFTGTATLTLTSTGGTCGAATASKTQVVNPNAVISLTSAVGTNAQVLCFNAAITNITYSVSGGGTGAGVTGLPAGTAGVFNAGVFTISGTPTETGTFNYTVTTTGTCAQANATGSITVNLNPTASAGPALSAICQGGTSAALGGSVGGSATGGTWSTPAGGTFLPNATTLNATWTPPAIYSGTATLTLTSSGGTCGSATASKTLVVNPTPTVSITNPAAVCSPATVNLTLPAVTAGSTAGLNFTYWTDLAGTISYPTPATATNGTYYIKGTVVATGCFEIRPVTVTVNPIPSTPVVTVVDNCNSTSTLSTIATGTLLWSTGATTPAITVNTAGTYTLTRTVSGCTSAPGSGTAAPRTTPSAPVVSSSAPVNVCPVTTINLTSLVTSSTPAGGSILYKTSNNPLGTNVSNPAAVGAGSYYIFYQNIEGCYSTGTLVTVSIINCPPDLTPTLIVSPNIMHGITSFNLTVRVTELNLVNTSGTITVNIPKDSRWTMPDGYNPSLTIIGSTPVDNIEWSYTSNATNHIFTSSTVIPAGGYSTFGFRVTFNPGSTRGIYTITSQLVSGGGGELKVTNNADSEKIDYFQQ